MPRRQSCLLGCVCVCVPEAASAVRTPSLLALVGLHVTLVFVGGERGSAVPSRLARVTDLPWDYALMLLTALVRKNYYTPGLFKKFTERFCVSLLYSTLLYRGSCTSYVAS
jgi:hypothetical protein